MTSSEQLSASQCNRLSQRAAAFQAPPSLLLPRAYRRVCETKQPVHDNPSAPDIILIQCEYEVNGYRQQQDQYNKDRGDGLEHDLESSFVAFLL